MAPCWTVFLRGSVFIFFPLEELTFEQASFENYETVFEAELNRFQLECQSQALSMLMTRVVISATMLSYRLLRAKDVRCQSLH